MKVVYRGRESRRTNSLPEGQEDVLELLSNNWNDYGYETTFMTVCRLNGERLELGSIRLLIAEQPNSRKFLNGLLKEGWDGEFPIPDIDYVSTPSEIAFYEQLDGVLPNRGSLQVASVLRDASYLLHLEEDGKAKKMVQTKGFKDSLQRERGSIEAYLDGWRILDRSAITAGDFEFKFKDVFGQISAIGFRFGRENSILPHDVNVLIGPNGAGKSQILHQMVNAWISDGQKDSEVGFAAPPNLSRLVVISYSPFELFPVDMAATKLHDKNAYRYCGFRGRSSPVDTNVAPSIRLSREIPKKDAASALLACVADDQQYHIIKDWGQKVGTIERVLRNAIDFDNIAFEVVSNARNGLFFAEEVVGDQTIQIKEMGESKRYVPVSAANVLNLNQKSLKRYMIAKSGVVFLKDGKAQELSSGQRLFTYVVINILGAIRRNSLVLVDEPELFLHPSLEIQLVEMLKQILHNFNSKAILATHSLVTVREVPADCVHVLERTDDGLVIKRPPFQTFGGDMQRISSYVFGDRSVSKPFEGWLRKQLDEHDGSADDLIAALGDDINEEMIVQIKAMERRQW
jgi:ABC-type Mn2+/Zn2+ transport system ATPase subunit